MVGSGSGSGFQNLVLSDSDICILWELVMNRTSGIRPDNLSIYSVSGRIFGQISVIMPDMKYPDF